MKELEVSLGAAFVAGLLSFFSPCILPLVPSYLAYLAGSSLEELLRREWGGGRFELLGRTAFFVLGFSLLFVLMGLSAGKLGQLLLHHMHLLRKAGGALILLCGLQLAGFLNFGWLVRERRVRFVPREAGWVSSFLLGAAFSAGWTPCVGPVLASILLVAGQSASLKAGALLLSAYSLGLGVPFVLSAAALGPVVGALRRSSRYLFLGPKLCGLLLAGLGLYYLLR
ncbi:cytochrome c biogenesis CcdA family protein [Desulfovirgula thermocuniculi]|uniref:cytochrome c biogenesis CcdA family protein n=1 Tax=Desulfovirgula thermocuniculi TaxID=348842 RepID=UPI000401DDB1|nr:cytochrome c biogenesis protein CcdA [Desulfovirgula thermocuniculi]